MKHIYFIWLIIVTYINNWKYWKPFPLFRDFTKKIERMKDIKIKEADCFSAKRIFHVYIKRRGRQDKILAWGVCRKRERVHKQRTFWLCTSHPIMHSFCSSLYCYLQKTTKLKQMLNSPDLEFIMEAHNGLCARIVQEAGNSANV